MSRTPTARTVAIRDQILSILRAEHPLPITTNDILVKLANAGENCNSPRGRRRDVVAKGAGATCHDWSGRWAGRDGCPAWCWYQPVYPQLVALMRLGLVERIRRDDHRSAFWRYVENDTDEQFNAIVDQMERAE